MRELLQPPQIHLFKVILQQEHPAAASLSCSLLSNQIETFPDVITLRPRFPPHEAWAESLRDWGSFFLPGAAAIGDAAAFPCPQLSPSTVWGRRTAALLCPTAIRAWQHGSSRLQPTYEDIAHPVCSPCMRILLIPVAVCAWEYCFPLLQSMHGNIAYPICNPCMGILPAPFAIHAWEYFFFHVQPMHGNLAHPFCSPCMGILPVPFAICAREYCLLILQSMYGNIDCSICNLHGNLSFSICSPCMGSLLTPFAIRVWEYCLPHLQSVHGNIACSICNPCRGILLTKQNPNTTN